MTPITYDGTDFPGRFPVPREYEAAVVTQLCVRTMEDWQRRRIVP